MSRHWHGLIAACSGITLLAVAVLSLPEPAQAQFGVFIRVPGIGFGFPGGGRCRHCGGGKHHQNDDDASSDNSSGSSSKDRNDRADTTAPPSKKDQKELFGNLAFLNPGDLGGTVAEVGTTKDINTPGKATSREDQRDWTGKITAIVREFKSESDKDKRVTTPGDVSEHAIEQSLNAAIKNAKLDTFESFLGEGWTSEHLRTIVLRQVLDELGSLFKGNSHGYAPMQEVDSLIQSAAQASYRRIFETSEFMAANRGSALFMQRLYQAQGQLLDARLREVTDDMISRAANDAIGKFEGALRQDENGFALRYRAQRIVFDCLSENVERISSSETSAAIKEEIQQRIEDTGKNECIKWLENQFGSDNRSLKPQKPMPLRVVWSETGPKDDPSMYGRATKGF